MTTRPDHEAFCSPDAFPITIRACENRDGYDAAIRLLSEFARSAGFTAQAMRIGSIIERLRRDGANHGPGVILLAYCYETPVGCVGLLGHPSATMKMRWLYVKPDYRRQGIGRKLLCDARRYAADRNQDHLVAEVPRSSVDDMMLAATAGFGIRRGSNPPELDRHCTLDLVISSAEPEPQRLAA